MSEVSSGLVVLISSFIKIFHLVHHHLMVDWFGGELSTPSGTVCFAAHMARARLRDRHQENLRQKLEMLKAQQGVAGTGTEEETGDGVGTTVKTEPDSQSEAVSIHESSDSGKEEEE